MPAEGLHAASGQVWVCLLGRSSRVLGMDLGLITCKVALVVRVRKGSGDSRCLWEALEPGSV